MLPTEPTSPRAAAAFADVAASRYRLSRPAATVLYYLAAGHTEVGTLAQIMGLGQSTVARLRAEIRRALGQPLAMSLPLAVATVWPLFREVQEDYPAPAPVRSATDMIEELNAATQRRLLHGEWPRVEA